MLNTRKATENPFAAIDERLSGLERISLELCKLFHAQTGGSPDAERPLSAQEASEFLGIPKNTLYALTSRREIPFCKRGKQLFFFRKDLLGWLDGGRQRTAAEVRAGAIGSLGTKRGRA
ncbi:helix-turn-helix domain-containing protein [Rufibacter latericius]|uniref:DNA-binding protein n=1 Tax=Rufibacter latericius TaxID=2487040 RepID=A0A3M9MTI6_9BACT|nr:helix-turn-helix domain-containing protein [Rufibacter latericius]RNI28830.1 DNA-binding protein [Rufibacter latericius]